MKKDSASGDVFDGVAIFFLKKSFSSFHFFVFLPFNIFLLSVAGPHNYGRQQL